MVEGLQRHAWAHTAAVLERITNMLRDPKSKAASAEDFNPYLSKAQTPDEPLMIPLALLKPIFSKDK